MTYDGAFTLANEPVYKTRSSSIQDSVFGNVTHSNKYSKFFWHHNQHEFSSKSTFSFVMFTCRSLVLIIPFSQIDR